MKKLQFRRIFAFVLALCLVLPLVQPLGVWATAPATVYLDPAAGSDTNSGTEAAPVKTLAAAYSKLLTGGSIVFLSDLSLTGNTLFPVSAYPVTLTSKTGAEGIITTGTLRMQGDTTFKDITVTFNATGLAFISGEGYDLTIDTGVNVVNLSGNQVNLVATKRFDATLNANPTLTVRSGKWDYIYATHGNSITGNVTVKLEGGSCTSLSPSYNATVTGNVNVSISNAYVGKLYLQPTHKNGKVTGTFTVSLGDNAKINSSAGSSGAVQGGTVVEQVGDAPEMGALSGYGAGSSLVLRSGRWTGTAEGFGSVTAEIAAGKVLTISSPITVDNITANGTLDFEGVGSLTAKTVTGTVNCTITGRVLKNNLYVSAPATADIRFPASYNVTNQNGQFLIHDLVNFEGLVIQANKAVKITFYNNPIQNNDAYYARKENIIEPYATATSGDNVLYYFPNLQGIYCFEASQTGMYTIFQQVYMSAEEAATYTMSRVEMKERDGEWDLQYYFGQTDELLSAVEDPNAKWQTEVPLETPVFTNTDKATQQMTTQPELEAFIADLDDAKDNMYVFSIGKSGKYNFDIPIVIFTKADLSGCTTLEQAAKALEASGLHNIGYKAQMHGDEHAAGEGALGVIKLLDQAENQYLLDAINIFVIPRMNPDGAYIDQRNMPTAIDTSLSNRDPNRDMLALNIIEQRHYLNAIQLLDPIAELDGHERQRNSMIGDIQIGAGWQDGTSRDILDIQMEMIYGMFGALSDVDLSGAWYGDYVNTDGVDQTRGFAANQGRIQVLVETRGIYNGLECYASRTASHIVTVMEYMQYCAANIDKMAAAVEKAQQEIVEKGKTYEESDTITLSWKSQAVEEYAIETVQYSLSEGLLPYTQTGKLYLAKTTRVAPTAYVIPANLANIDKILEMMDMQEISYYKLPAHANISLQQYSGSVDADGVVSNVALSAEQMFVFHSGAYVFQMDQVNARILALLLEPDSPSKSDFVELGRISVASDGTFPIYRYIHDLTSEQIPYVVDASGVISTVYVSSTGNNNNSGKESAPVATLEKAYEILCGSLADSDVPGTIVLLDDCTITANGRYDLPAHNFPITIKGATASVKLIFNPTTIGESTQQLAFHGDTTLDNLVFRTESTSKLDYIFACGNKLTIGRGVTTSAKSSLPNLVGGDYRAAVVDTDLTVLGGTWYAVYVGSFREGHTGTAKVTIDGATIQQNIRGLYEKTSTGNFVIDLKNTTFKGVYPSYQGNVSGTTTVILREGVAGTVYTGNGSSGTVSGLVTVVLSGADLTKVKFNNGAQKDKLVYSDGEITYVAGFDAYGIDTDTTVTLTSDLTAETITGKGEVILNGFTLNGISADVEKVSLRANAEGLYFTGNFTGAEGMVYGIALSVTDETPNAKDGTGSLYTVGQNSVLVKDILKSNGADMVIYARAYVKSADGTIIYGETVEVTFRQLVYAADAMWDSLSTAQQQTLKALYEANKTVMQSWKVPNIKG